MSAAATALAIAGVILAELALLLALFAMLSRWGDDDEDHGDDGGGGGPPGRSGPPPPSDDGDPDWWPEFEREFAAYVGDGRIGRGADPCLRPPP
jgi:hypothetical protein